MYCTYTLTIACLKMFLRNKQAIFFSLFMPTMILFIFGNISGGSPEKMTVGLVTHSPDDSTKRLVDQIRAVKSFDIKEGQLDSELAEMNKGNRSAVLDIPDDLMSHAGGHSQLSVYANNGQPIEAGMVMGILQQFAYRSALAAEMVQPKFEIKQQSVDAKKSRYIEFLLPGVIAMSIMQMSVFSVAFVFAQYRERGILKRLLATPMKPVQFVTANIITRLFMSFAQAAIFVAMGVALFHVPVHGAYWLVAVCVVLGSLMFLGLGFTISGAAKNMETVPVLSNLVVFPMLFLGNVFFAANNMPAWLQPIADHLPLTYLANAMRGVITNGAGPMEIEKDLIAMTAWAALLIVTATITFRFGEREAA